MKWIEYDYVCNADKGINLHKKVEYNEANLAIAEAEACNGEYTITDDGVENNESIAECTRKSIGAAAEVLTDDVALAFGLPTGATVNDAFIKSAAGAAKISMNEPTVNDNVAAGYSIGKTWLRPGYELENVVYNMSVSAFEPYACTIGKTGQVFAVVGNGDNKSFSATVQVPSAEGWVYAVITVNGGAASVKATFGDTAIVLQDGINVVCAPFVGASFIFEATYSTANAASKGSVVIENFTVIDKIATLASGSAGGGDITFNNITNICKANTPFATYAVSSVLFQQMRDGEWRVVYGISNDVGAAYEMPIDANPEQLMLKLQDSRDRVGDVKYSIRTNMGDHWLLCNGSPISRDDYPELYQLFEDGTNKKYYEFDTTVFSNNTRTRYFVANNLPFLVSCEQDPSNSKVVWFKILSFSDGLDKPTTHTVSVTMSYNFSNSWLGSFSMTYADGTYAIYCPVGVHASGNSYLGTAVILFSNNLRGDWYASKVQCDTPYLTLLGGLQYVNGYWVVLPGGWSTNSSSSTLRDNGFWYLLNSNFYGNWTFKAMRSVRYDYTVGIKMFVYSGGYYGMFVWQKNYNGSNYDTYWYYSTSIGGTYTVLKNNSDGSAYEYSWGNDPINYGRLMCTSPMLCMAFEYYSSYYYCRVTTYANASMWGTNTQTPSWRVNCSSRASQQRAQIVGDYIAVLSTSTSGAYPATLCYKSLTDSATSNFTTASNVFTRQAFLGYNAIHYDRGNYIMFGYDTDYAFKAKYAKTLGTSYSASVILEKDDKGTDDQLPKAFIKHGDRYFFLFYYWANSTYTVMLCSADDPTGDWTKHVLRSDTTQTYNHKMWCDGKNIIVQYNVGSNTGALAVQYAPVDNLTKLSGMSGITIVNAFPRGGCYYYTLQNDVYTYYVCSHIDDAPVKFAEVGSTLTIDDMAPYFMYKPNDFVVNVSELLEGYPAIPALSPEGCYAYIKAKEVEV